MSSSHRRWSVAAVAAACLATVALHFWHLIAGGFATTLSDNLDGFIQVAIVEHWYNVVRGLEPWNQPAYFYPWPDTLGYNDAYLIYGLLTVPLRYLGVDPLTSLDAAIAVLRAIGFFACYLFARQVLSLRLGWALLAAALFTLANNSTLHEVHAQLVTVCFAPLAGWLVWRSAKSIEEHDYGPAIAFGAVLSLLAGAWLLTSFYMAWFTFLFIATVGLVALCVRTFRARLFAAFAGGGVASVALIAVVFGLSLVPFLAVYLPTRAQTGGHSLPEVMSYCLLPFHLLDVGSGNLLLGRIDGWFWELVRHRPAGFDERTVGFPLVIALLAIAGGWTSFTAKTGVPLVRGLAIATAISLALIVAIKGWGPWMLIYQLVPGASGIRVVGRYALILAFPVSLLAAAFLQSRAGKWPGWLMALAVTLLIVEELTVPSVAGANRAAELHDLSMVPAAPASCTSFYASLPRKRAPDPRPIVNDLYPHNVDAMMVAELRHIPTINGFASFNVPDWNFQKIGDPDYLRRVRAYVRAHRLTGVCGLDMQNNRWGAAL